MVLASAIEPLRAARDLSGQRLFSWQLSSMTGGPVTSSSRIAVSVDQPLARVGATDALILVSGYGMRDHLNREAAALILRKARGVPIVGGLDTGAWLLAHMGLLAGRRAAIHWMAHEALGEAFPEILVSEEPYVVDRGIMTCGGAQTVLSWSLDLIGEHAGDALRYDVGNMFGRAEAGDGGAVGVSFPGRMTDRALPPAIQRAILVMRETAEHPMPLMRIAERAALSTRSMDRLFRRYLSISAGGYYRQIRLSHARALAIETDLSLGEIASRTGFSSPSTLARAYRRHFGETVRQSKATGSPHQGAGKGRNSG